jgi:hypothetical protein
MRPAAVVKPVNTGTLHSSRADGDEARCNGGALRVWTSIERPRAETYCVGKPTGGAGGLPTGSASALSNSSECGRHGGGETAGMSRCCVSATLRSSHMLSSEVVAAMANDTTDGNPSEVA